MKNLCIRFHRVSHKDLSHGDIYGSEAKVYMDTHKHMTHSLVNYSDPIQFCYLEENKLNWSREIRQETG